MSLSQSIKKMIAAFTADASDVIQTIESPLHEVEELPIVQALAPDAETFVTNTLAKYGVDEAKLEEAGKELIDGLTKFNASAAEASATGQPAEVPASTASSTSAPATDDSSATSSTVSTDPTPTTDQPPADPAGTATEPKAD